MKLSPDQPISFLSTSKEERFAALKSTKPKLGFTENGSQITAVRMHQTRDEWDRSEFAAIVISETTLVKAIKGRSFFALSESA